MILDMHINRKNVCYPVVCGPLNVCINLIL